MISAPNTSVSLGFAPLAGDNTESALLVAEIGADGEGTANRPERVTSATQAAEYFGTSQGTRAAALWFTLGLGQNIDLYAFGLDATDWTTNTWTLTVSGTASQSGTLFLRLGSDAIAVSVASGDDQFEAATAIDAAITAADTPFSSSLTDGVVTVTSQHVGVAANRIDVSVDKYRDRGERGIPGLTVLVANKATATGTPSSLVTTHLEDSNHSWLLHNNPTTAFLDSLATWSDVRWSRGNRIYSLLAFASGTTSAFTSVVDTRNDNTHAYLSSADSPAYELEFVVAQLRAIKDEQAERGTVPIATQGRRLPVAAPTAILDPNTILQAGGSPYRSVRGRPTSVRVVNSRRANDLDQEDLRFFDIGIVLAVRELLDRVEAALDTHRGRVILESPAVNAAQAKFVTSEASITALVQNVLIQAWRDALLSGADEATLRTYLSSVRLIEEGGIVTGFRLQLDPRAVSLVTTLSALVLLKGNAQ